jgi:CelD/BcsL family acetyltransferase involved in cellulose biosynthesis
MNFTEGSWRTKPVKLRFTLGEVTLFSYHVQLAVLDVQFTDLADDAFSSWSNWQDAPPPADGILILSQPIASRLPRLTYYPHAIRYVPFQYQRFYLEFSQTFAEYLQQFSAKMRFNRKREVRRFAEFSGGKVDWREYRSPPEMQEFLKHACELSRKTFQERLLDAGLPSTQEFATRLQQLAGENKVRAYLLFCRGRVVSFLLADALNPEILVYRYLGYDPEYGAWSPGTVLHFLAIEKLFSEKDFRMLDFTEGEGAHKKFFATGSKLCADIYFLRRTQKHRLILQLHSATCSLAAAMARLLDRVGLKARVKKFIRSKA